MSKGQEIVKELEGFISEVHLGNNEFEDVVHLIGVEDLEQLVTMAKQQSFCETTTRRKNYVRTTTRIVRNS